MVLVGCAVIAVLMLAPFVLMLINALLLVVGCFMEAIAAMIILIPVLIPVVEAAHVDLTHFGLIMVFNLIVDVSYGFLDPRIRYE